jgi:WD40 repeat protein
VEVWSTEGVRLWEQRIHAAQVRFVAFAPGGDALLSAPGWRRQWLDIDGDVEHRDFTAKVTGADGEARFVLHGHSDSLTSASWSPDGRRVLTTSEDRTARVWSLDERDPEGRVACAVLHHDKSVDHGQFFPDGWRILTTMTTSEALVWDRAGRPLAELRGHVSGAYAGAVVGTGDRVLTGSMDMRLLLWDAHSRWCGEWRPEGPLACAGFDAGGETLFTVSRAGVVQHWARNRFRPVATMEIAASLEANELVSTGAPSAQSGSLLVGTSRGRILEVAPDGAITVLRPSASATTMRGAPPQPVGFLLPVRERVLFSLGPRRVHCLANTVAPRVPTNGDGHEDVTELPADLTSLAWMPDGSGFAVGTNRAQILEFDARGGQRSQPLQGLGSTVMGLAGTPAGGRLFAATRDGLLFRVDGDGGATQLADVGVYLFRLAVSEDGAWLAAACGDRRVRILDDSGRLHVTLPPVRDGIRSLAFSPDGRRLLVASNEGDMKLWPLELSGTGEELLAGSPYQAALERARATAR